MYTDTGAYIPMQIQYIDTHTDITHIYTATHTNVYIIMYIHTYMHTYRQTDTHTGRHTYVQKTDAHIQTNRYTNT